METRTMVEQLIERENKYLVEQTVGTDEYNASLERLLTLEAKLADTEKVRDDKKDRIVKYILEGVRVGGGIALPIFGIVAITAQEREITYTSALKSLIGCFIPGKNKI